MRLSLASALVVSLFLAAVFVPGISIPASAGHPPCKPPACNPGGPGVTVSNFVINGHTPYGWAILTWSTNPSAACSTVTWYRSDGTLIGSANAGCGVHTYTIASGLTPVHGTFYAAVTATYTGYNSGSTGMTAFTTTDISVDPAKEDYGTQKAYPYFMGDCARAGKGLNYDVLAEMAGDVAHDAATKRSTDVTPHTVFSHINAIGDDWCNIFGTYVALWKVRISLIVYDDTSPFVPGTPLTDLWIQTYSVQPKDSTAFKSGQVTYSLGFGLEYLGASFQVGASYDPGTMATYEASKAMSIQSDGSLRMGYFDISYNPHRDMGLDVTFMTNVYDTKAQPHLYDHLRFALEFKLVVAEVNPPNIYTNTMLYIVTITLGDGQSPVTGNSDQFTDLQPGAQTLPWIPTSP